MSVSVAYRTGVAPRTGLSARIELEVTEADTAEAFRSGTVPVLATPRLVALCEEASCQGSWGRASSCGSSWTAPPSSATSAEDPPGTGRATGSAGWGVGGHGSG